MAAIDPAKKNEVFGGPTKRFFVAMLTRDIELSDAILDLVDNCVDGAMRSSKADLLNPKVFEGYHANLELDGNHFALTDNCGGIPEDYINDAFHLGRPKIDQDADLPTIGMFGIGMKRAIFKISEEALVVSNSAEAHNTVAYTANWLDPDNDNDWYLPIDKAAPKDEAHGVGILVDRLKPSISQVFAREAYIDELKRDLSLHFAYIMQKGFKIFVNGDELRPATLPLVSGEFVSRSDAALLPFDFEISRDDVDIKVTVGFFRTLVLDEEIDEEAIVASDIDSAGISVVCNDRVVLLNDKTMATGWGSGGAPRYHPQFRAIAGLITIYSADADKLPLSTTKRGLDAASDIYLIARDQCIEGIKTFTSFTNKWKGMERDAAATFRDAGKKDARTEVALAREHGIAVRNLDGSKRFKPNLPVPPTDGRTARITFTKPKEQIEEVSLALFGETTMKPSVVGEEAFDIVLRNQKDE